MGKIKQTLRAMGMVMGIGNVKLPADWPKNGFKEELNKAGGFKDSFMSTAKGGDNKAMALWMNAKIVDTRDQQIAKWLSSKGIKLE